MKVHKSCQGRCLPDAPEKEILTTKEGKLYCLGRYPGTRLGRSKLPVEICSRKTDAASQHLRLLHLGGATMWWKVSRITR